MRAETEPHLPPEEGTMYSCCTVDELMQLQSTWNPNQRLRYLLWSPFLRITERSCPFFSFLTVITKNFKKIRFSYHWFIRTYWHQLSFWEKDTGRPISLGDVIGNSSGTPEVCFFNSQSHREVFWSQVFLWLSWSHSHSDLIVRHQTVLF